MKKVSVLLMFCCVFSVVSLAQDTWNIDNGHSNINFEVGWEDFSVRTGEFKVFEGTIITNADNELTEATYFLKVDPNSIDVITSNLSGQIKGKRFLESEKYPEITFSATGATEISDSTFITSGKLKIHGVEKDQEVLIKYKGQKEGRRSLMMGLEVSLHFNRNDFGLEWGAPRLAETVYVVGHLLYNKRVEEQ